MCADQARKMFDEKKTADRVEKDFIVTSTFTSHYDTAPQRCYLAMQMLMLNIPGQEHTKVYELYDAFEGNEIANFDQQNNEKPNICSVTPRGRDIMYCQSRSEFFHLVYRHFGVEQF